MLSQSLHKLIQNLIFLPQWLHIPLVNMAPIIIVYKNGTVPMFYIFSYKRHPSAVGAQRRDSAAVAIGGLAA